MRFRQYIDLMILICCLIITINIHPNKTIEEEISSSDESKMIYVFHDYEWNKYIMNENIHGSTDSRDYLFNDEIPNDLKWDEQEYVDWVSMGDLNDENNAKPSWKNENQSGTVKDNQVTIDDIMSDLWLDPNSVNNEKSETNQLIISIWDIENDNDSYYSVDENGSDSLIIQRIDDNQNEEIEDSNETSDSDNLLDAKVFTFVEEWWILPILVSRDDLFAGNSSETIAYVEDSVNGNYETKKGWLTIIEEYASCMTPRWYKIPHWDSVLAYKQIDDTPNICNIERRFCWKWKLSWTYTQQWCSVNKNYTYERWWDVKVESNETEKNTKWRTVQNADWSVSIVSSEIKWSSVLETAMLNTIRFHNSFKSSFGFAPFAFKKEAISR